MQDSICSGIDLMQQSILVLLLLIVKIQDNVFLIGPGSLADLPLDFLDVEGSSIRGPFLFQLFLTSLNRCLPRCATKSLNDCRD